MGEYPLIHADLELSTAYILKYGITFSEKENILCTVIPLQSHFSYA